MYCTQLCSSPLSLVLRMLFECVSLYLQSALLYTLMSVRLTYFLLSQRNVYATTSSLTSELQICIYVEQVVSKVFMAQAFLISSAIPNFPSVQTGHLRHRLPGDHGHG